MVPLLRSLANVNDYIRALAGFHETYDLFLTPTLAKPPLEVGATHRHRCGCRGPPAWWPRCGPASCSRPPASSTS